MTLRLLATGTILLAVGLTLAAVVAEWFAAFDACLASASCVAPGSGSTLGGFLGLLAAGVLFAVAGLVLVIAGFRSVGTEPRGVAS
ncbi:MAG: hypothetical protein L3J96_01800 [Thermoplasmata archaeon]|nr:hypothetical protein [Thermoplasmata archaeon]